MEKKLMVKFTPLLVVMSLLASVNAYAQRDNVTCGITQGMPLTNAYGPYDATLPGNQSLLPIVVTAHFTKSVEQLLKGTTTVDPLPDIDYTLRAIPNYHPALKSVMNYEFSGGKLRNDPRFYTVDCYFKRALYLAPKDYKATVLYAIYLHRKKKMQDARTYYERALKLQPDFIDAHYNFGLLLFALGELDSAFKHASIAYDGGYQLPGLKRKLVAKGYSFK